MSYDLTIVRTREGESAEAAAERIGGEEAEPRENGPAELARKQEVIAAILAAAPMLVRFGEDGGLGGGIEGAIELNDEREPGTGLQVTVFEDDYVSVAVPYWHHGAAAKEVFGLMRRVCGVLEKRWRMRTIDPQMGREVVEWASDEAVMLKMYEGISGRMDELAGGARRGKRWWEFWK